MQELYEKGRAQEIARVHNKTKDVKVAGAKAEAVKESNLAVVHKAQQDKSGQRVRA
jgi:hypothetical protein